MAQLKDLLVNGDERIIGNSYNNTPKVAYGTCATAAATAAKEVVVADPAWNLQVGDIIGIKFTYQNTASSMTINVNGSGAKQISYANTRPYTGTSGKYCGYAGYTTFYQYDGTYWHWLAFGADDNSDTYTSAYCGTAAGTQAKAASCTYYTASNNSYLHINFRYANSYAGAITLNVDGKGAKPIYINGTASSSSNYTLPAGPYICYCDGNNYYFRTDGKLTASITGDAATVNGKTVAANVPSDAKFTDTTYESKAAVNGGTAVSLVTTGEKYTWDNKTSNTGTVTSIATGAGLVGGTITGSGTIKADLKSETKSTLEATAMGSTANKQYAVGLDKNGDLSVNIPWTDTTYESKAAASGGTNVSLVTTGEKYTWNNKSDLKNVVDGSATKSVRTTGSYTEDNSYTIGQYAFSEGYQTKASGWASHAEGGYSVASGSSSHAEGNSAEASGKYSHAEGDQTEASGDYSHAEGRMSTATADYTHAEGQSTASKRFAHAEGWSATASGEASHAEGISTVASSNYSHAEGSYTTVSGQYGHVEGRESIAKGMTSHAEGNGTLTDGISAHSEGDCTWAYGGSSHAEGGTVSSVIGTGTITAIDETNLKITVSGLSGTSTNFIYQLFSTSLNFDGRNYITNVSGSSSAFVFTLSRWDSNLAVNASLNIRYRNIARGNDSHVEGQGTRADNTASHAEGIGTYALADAQHVQGKWNTTNSNMAHIVGNGTAYNARSNAYTLDWNGNGTYAGKLTVGTGPTNNMDVATKQYVDTSEHVYVGTTAPSDSRYDLWVDTTGALNNTALINLIYPVGSIYISVNSVNPGTLFGIGTWTVFGQGKTLIGVDPNDSDFRNVEALGGKKNVTLSASIGACNNGTTALGYIAENPSAYEGTHAPSYIVSGTNWSYTNWNHSTPVTEFSSTNRDTSILQPYITVYMWKRTA